MRDRRAAQGGGLVVFALVVRIARDLTENRRVSALVQGGGYVVAATGPTVMGAVHEATGGWTAPLLVVLGAIALLAVAGAASASPGSRSRYASCAGDTPGLRWGTRPHGPDRRRCAMDVWIIWLMLAAVLGIAELFTLSAALGLLGGAAVVTAIAAAFGAPVAAQLLVFAASAGAASGWCGPSSCATCTSLRHSRSGSRRSSGARQRSSRDEQPQRHRAHRR